MKPINKLLSVTALALMTLGFLNACQSPEYPAVTDGTLAETINSASRTIVGQLDNSPLKLNDCVNFYSENYPENTMLITKADFIKAARETCPSQMALLNKQLNGALGITLSHLTSKQFWHEYDRSQTLLINKVLKR